MASGNSPRTEENLGRLDGVGADRALNELVGIALHEGVMIKGGGLALVAVDGEVERLGLAISPTSVRPRSPPRRDQGEAV